MPLPKPKDGESKDEWMERCMGNDAMKEEFPDNDQCLAVCFQRWRDKDKNSIAADELRYIIERRYVPTLELRVTDGEKNQLAGYAAVFDSWSEDLGFFKEQISRGAFAKTIKDGDIRALINHDPNLIIGRTRNGTLRLAEDEKGLSFEVDLPDTTYARDLKESIRRKDITQNSFGFLTVRDEWSPDGKRRTLQEVRLFDISPVTFPAYKQTSVKLRLHQLGIDYDALNLALVHAGSNLTTESDAEHIRLAVKILSECLPKPIEPPAAAGDGPGHSEEAAEPDLASTLIRVRMASTSIKKLTGR